MPKSAIQPSSRLAIGLLLVTLASLILTHQTLAGNADATNTIDRTLEPVVVTGADLPAFLGAPVDHLFVYVYRTGEWGQVPAQVDEVTSDGRYAAAEDNMLDADDEIVFMAQDLGDQAVDTSPSADSTPIGVQWYEIEVADPLDPAKKGWAYVVQSNILDRTFTVDYVSFDSFLHRINGATYHLGFATPRPWIDYLTLGDNVVDILDRTKIRLYCGVPLICPFTEAMGPGIEDELIKDGSVRLIVRNGRVLAYGSMATWITTVGVPENLAGDVRFSTDFNDKVIGATFYNTVVPDGATVDGTPDAVPESPLSSWWQLSTSMGTVIQVADTSAIGGAQTNYYVDDATTDGSDTGDRKHYADTGIYIADPNPSLSYTFTSYFLPETQPNVGGMYADYFSHPLTVTARLQQLELPVKVYLPVIGR